MVRWFDRLTMSGLWIWLTTNGYSYTHDLVGRGKVDGGVGGNGVTQKEGGGDTLFPGYAAFEGREHVQILTSNKG